MKLLLPVAVVLTGQLLAGPIEFEPVADVDGYEIQWFHEKPASDEFADGPVEMVSEPRAESRDYRFFRVRSVRGEVKGQWSAVQPVSVAAGSAVPSFSGSLIRGRVEYLSLRTAGALHLRVHSTDSGSGVEDVFIRLNDGPFERKPDPVVTITTDGPHDIYWYAKDRVGLKTKIQSRHLMVDSSPPLVSCRVLGSLQSSDGEVTEQAQLVITASDEGVGMGKLLWRSAISSSWSDYTEPIPLKEHVLGTNGAIFVRAFDELGNEAPMVTFAFRIATGAEPELPAALARFGKGKQEKVPREGIAIDGLKPGEALLVEMPDGKKVPLANGDRLMVPGGKQKLKIKFTDSLGRETEQEIEVFSDREPPQTEIRVIHGDEQ
ncbi:MAG: hypothetical protein HS115_16930 [Spirochaetales bacterium]|nr:hypothetical protein [Spirochaetales bacterium]